MQGTVADQVVAQLKGLHYPPASWVQVLGMMGEDVTAPPPPATPSVWF